MRSPRVSGQNDGHRMIPSTAHPPAPTRPCGRQWRGRIEDTTPRQAPIAAALFTALLAATPLADAGQDALPLSDEHRKWLEEEVIYIISDREKDAFTKLQSEAERAAFIAAFWRRRDPEPLTPENEFRTEHYERIEYANTRLSGETAIPGWMTDRGRLYIQLGPPEERETFPAIPGLYPAELWFYLQRDEYLLPPLYILFFREYAAGPYIQFNHLIHQPEELLPAHSFTDGESRAEAFVTLQEISPQLAHASITMRADRGVTASLVQPEMEQLQTQTLLSDINRAPHRLLDTAWVTGAEAGRGLVESAYLFNFVPSAGVARVLPGPSAEAWFVHYAIEIEPQHFTLAREEDGNEYFTRFEIQGEVTTADGDVIHDFAATPFLRLGETDLQAVGARPFAYRGMFPLMEGAFRFRLILKNAARTEYTVFEDDILVPDSGPFLSRPVLLHGLPDESEGAYGTWAPGEVRLLPNAHAVAAVGTLVRAAASAPGHGSVLFRVASWSAGEDHDSPVAPVLEEEVPVRNGFAVWTLSTASWDSGRYLLSARASEEERAATFDLNARRSVAVPWGLTDSFDAEAPGALPAAVAEQWLRADDRARARDLFETALEANPDLRRARLVLGRFALDDGKPRAAVRLLEPALAQAPEDVGILRALGDAHRESGNAGRAAELYERSLPLQTPDPALLNALAWSLASAGEQARAIPYLEQSLRITPEQPEILELLATLRATPSPIRQ